jgi:hypothetical protein
VTGALMSTLRRGLSGLFQLCAIISMVNMREREREKKEIEREREKERESKRE